jgi:hypothetical protein
MKEIISIIVMQAGLLVELETYNVSVGMDNDPEFVSKVEKIFIETVEEKRGESLSEEEANAILEEGYADCDRYDVYMRWSELSYPAD